MKCVEVYKELYHQEPFGVAFCPYRISPLGAHIDHQYGKINGLAIDKGIHMAYHPKQNGVVELQSLNFPKRAQFFVSAVPEEKQGDWADHLRGAEHPVPQLPDQGKYLKRSASELPASDHVPGHVVCHAAGQGP